MSSGCVRRVNRLRVHDRIVESKFAERQTNENSFRHLSSQSERLAAVIYGTSRGNQHQMAYQIRPLSHLSHTHLLDVADGQLELLARMTLEHITSTWTLALRATGWRFANARNRDKDLFEYPL